MCYWCQATQTYFQGVKKKCKETYQSIYDQFIFDSFVANANGVLSGVTRKAFWDPHMGGCGKIYWRSWSKQKGLSQIHLQSLISIHLDMEKVFLCLHQAQYKSQYSKTLGQAEAYSSLVYVCPHPVSTVHSQLHSDWSPHSLPLAPGGC